MHQQFAEIHRIRNLKLQKFPSYGMEELQSEGVYGHSPDGAFLYVAYYGMIQYLHVGAYLLFASVSQLQLKQRISVGSLDGGVVCYSLVW